MYFGFTKVNPPPSDDIIMHQCIEVIKNNRTEFIDPFCEPTAQIKSQNARIQGILHIEAHSGNKSEGSVIMLKQPTPLIKVLASNQKRILSRQRSSSPGWVLHAGNTQVKCTDGREPLELTCVNQCLFLSRWHSSSCTFPSSVHIIQENRIFRLNRISLHWISDQQFLGDLSKASWQTLYWLEHPQQHFHFNLTGQDDFAEQILWERRS